MVTTTYLNKINNENTRLQMIANARNDLVSLQLNRCTITEGSRCKNWQMYNSNKWTRNTPQQSCSLIEANTYRATKNDKWKNVEIFGRPNSKFQATGLPDKADIEDDAPLPP